MTKYIRFYKDFLLCYKREQILSFFILLMSAGLSIISPYFLKVIIDEGISKGDNNKMILYCLLMTGCVLLGFVVSKVKVRMFLHLSQKITSNLKEVVIAKMNRLPSDHQMVLNKGSLQNIMIDDINQIKTISATILSDFCVNCVTLIGLVVILSTMSIPIAIISIFLLIVYMILQKTFGEKTKSLSKEMSHNRGNHYENINETILEIDNVRATHTLFFFNERLKDSQNEVFSTEKKLAENRNNASISGQLIKHFGLILTLLIGALLIQRNQSTYGSLFTLIIYVQKIYAPAIALSYNYLDLKKAQGSIDRILQVLNVTQELSYGNKVIDNSCKLKIAFNDVNFSYLVSQHKIYDHLNLSLQEGEVIGIIGENGIGKSTFTKLLLRILDYSSGEILINESSIKSYSVATIRDNVKSMSQEGFVFKGSLRDNIKTSNPIITDPMIKECLKDIYFLGSGNTEEINLDTMIDWKGANLSGGQRQKIALCRLLLSKPKVAILDEPTAAMDLFSEEKVKKMIVNTLSESLVIIITHREPLLSICDRVFRINNHQLVEQKLRHSENYNYG